MQLAHNDFNVYKVLFSTSYVDTYATVYADVYNGMYAVPNPLLAGDVSVVLFVPYLIILWPCRVCCIVCCIALYEALTSVLLFVSYAELSFYTAVLAVLPTNFHAALLTISYTDLLPTLWYMLPCVVRHIVCCI